MEIEKYSQALDKLRDNSISSQKFYLGFRIELETYFTC